MKSLYESIMQSRFPISKIEESIMQSRFPVHKVDESILNKSGVGKIYLIQKWLDEHGIKNYTINSKEEINVDGYVDLSGCGLTEFPQFIQFGVVKGNFGCAFNSLTSLRGCPRVVKKSFYCHGNNLTTLEGAPSVVGQDFYCSTNKLTSLEGAPEAVGGSFYCGLNRLNTLEGAPEGVGGYFNCSYNSTKFTKDDVREVCKVKKGIIVK